MNFLLIDLNNYFSRFYFANKDNCIERYLKLIKDSLQEFSPKYLCNLIDAPISFRKGLYPHYKSHRAEKPADYYELLNNLKFNLKQFKYSYQTSKTLEAEDLANLFTSNIDSFDFIVLSNDKDCLQLESETCKIFDYFNKRDESGQFIKFIKKSYENLGLSTKEEFLLYLSLMGDSSDNIPGVKGIGSQKAFEIIKRCNNYNLLIEIINEKNILDNYTARGKLFDLIRNDIENFQLSYKLVSLFNEKYKFDLEKYKI